ncbi:hypothetical protein BAE44_0000681, partial [Dichanthelium oligosanthes]
LESGGTCWVSNKSFMAINIVTSAAFWAVENENDLCFVNFYWQSMERLLMKALSLAHNWLILCPEDKKTVLSGYITNFKKIASKPEMMSW